MTVSSPVKTEFLGKLRKRFGNEMSVWEFSISDGKFIAEGGIHGNVKICKSREELRHLWSMMIGYGFTQV